ncbi:hypothetical protein H4Q26_011542 [Puccinia striiformis f. sp. tritici PST-130]|nr:hypothetical protein H4Q26_011542 [Puccinia striiformis f. sp. tritici PST-130]
MTHQILLRTQHLLRSASQSHPKNAAHRLLSSSHPTTTAILHQPYRAFSSHPIAHSQDGADIRPTSLYTFTEDESMLRDLAQRFAEEVVAPKIIKGLFDNGFMGIETSQEHGGSGASFTSAILVIEELAKVDPSVSLICDVHNTIANTTIRNYGSKALLDKYMPDLSTSKVACFCLSEPGSGSDAFALATKATKDSNGDYIINGSKMWITNSKEAEIFVVFANLDPSKGYKGVSCFLLEKSMGIEIAKKEEKLGIKASSTCTLNFDNIKYAIEILNEGRIGIAAQMVGLAQGAFDKAVKYTYQRKQFGKPVGEFQGMQFQFADVHTEIEAARMLTYNAARLKEEGKPFTEMAAMAKLFSSQVAQNAAGNAIEWCGGVGFTRETGIEKYWRDSKIGAIYEGSSNIQRQTLAKFIQKRLG